MPAVTWNRDVFTVIAPHVNAASINWYFPGALKRGLRDTAGDALQLTTGADTLGADLDHVIADLDSIGGAAAKLPIYFGEWGRQVNLYDVIKDNHKLYDGVYFAGCFNRMIERAGRVMGGNLCFFINTFGVIQSEGDRHFVTAGYLVNQLYRWSCRTDHAQVDVRTDQMLVPALQDINDALFVADLARSDRRTAILDAAATVDRSGTSLYLTHRGLEGPISVTVTGLRPADAVAKFRYVIADSPFSYNTINTPNTVRIAEVPVIIRSGCAEVLVPPCTAGCLIAGPLAGALATT
jgi:alpha-L-arabinofuranosidase